MEYDAFISYRHADGDAARGVTKLLRAFGQSVFIDEGIAAGEEWAPEIWQALAASRALMVLWSRSASKSQYVHDEWTRAPAGCRIIALKLDGEALPPALGKFNAITGLDVAGRLIARSVELMKERKLSPAKAQAQLLQELANDGVVLEEKQKRALAAFLPVLAVSGGGVSFSWSSLALAGAGAAGAFGIGFWIAHQPPTLCVHVDSAIPSPSGTAAAVASQGASGAGPAAPCPSPSPSESAAAALRNCEAESNGETRNVRALRTALETCQAHSPGGTAGAAAGAGGAAGAAAGTGAAAGVGIVNRRMPNPPVAVVQPAALANSRTNALKAAAGGAPPGPN